MASRVEEWIADLSVPASSSAGAVSSEASTHEAVSLPSVVSQESVLPDRPPLQQRGATTASSAWLMPKTEGGPVRVRLGHIRAPNEFWVTPLPQRQDDGGKIGWMVLQNFFVLRVQALWNIRNRE